MTKRHQTLVSSFRVEREIFVIRGLRLTLFPHVPRTSPLSSSVFHAACALSAPSGHLPLEGKAAIRGKPAIADLRASPRKYLRRFYIFMRRTTFRISNFSFN